MIEVFRTNVQKKSQANKICKNILEQFPAYLINFDLSDCHKILRIKSSNIQADKIIQLLATHGFKCFPLK